MLRHGSAGNRESEIFSPGSRGKDLEIKRKIYARFGVQEYWVVDPDAETIEVLAWGESRYSKNKPLIGPLMYTD